MLAIAYSLLLLTFTSQVPHAVAMKRCVLLDDKMAKIWSVGNIEIGVAYLGVFASMLFYFLRHYRESIQHIKDLIYAMAYLVGSFALDWVCVQSFDPFVAMLVGDAIVMTFTLAVSRQVWFQRLLGVFVPIIFLTCGIGHFLEGMSYWQLTYPINVPWTMVTADIGFAVLVNSSRFPAFIRGEDIMTELTTEKARNTRLEQEVQARIQAEEEKHLLLDQLRRVTEQQRHFTRNVLASVTEGRLTLCFSEEDLPQSLPQVSPALPLTAIGLRNLRRSLQNVLQEQEYGSDRQQDFTIAVHEAAMNAVTHGGGGEAVISVGCAPDSADWTTVQVRITDHGKGIDMETLPRATLELGYSSAGTLGHGFWIILRTADRVWLYTTPQGTTIVLEQDREKPAQSMVG
ncbi:MAG: hypothetical protein OHK0029_36560 [Armatimonadaceae bacterium]